MTDISYYIPDTDDGRKHLRDAGSSKGKSRAKSDYPTYVYRDRQQIEQQAAEAFETNIASERWYDERTLHHIENRSDKEWKELYGSGKSWQKDKASQISLARDPLYRWDAQVSEARQQYTIAYISAYLEYIEREDARRAPAPPPEPQPQPDPTPAPAAPTNTITVDGATFTVRKIERSADKVRYFMEINHPGVTNGTEALTIVHPITINAPTLRDLAEEASLMLKSR